MGNRNYIIILGLTFTLSTLRISSSSKDSCAADVQWMQSTGLKYRRCLLFVLTCLA